MKLLETVVKRAQRLTGWEIIGYKLCVLSAAALIAAIIPGIMQGPTWLYIALAVVFGTVAVGTLVQKEGNYIKDVLMGNLGKQFFKKYTMIDFAVFETTGVIFGLLIIKLFPVVMTIHIGWYIGVFAATAGYLFAKIFTKK